MEKDEICVKIMPLNPSAPRRCGVCDELLVIPPIYSCKSVSFICGPCFEGYRYYLDDDELRAADNPIRQILYENFACRFLFYCSYYPHCKGQMAFHHEAKLHYKEYCIAKVFWIFKCPIARANRWFLKPNQHYCDWRFTRISLFDNEIEKLMKHVRFLHSEYILERPHILNLKDLLHHNEPRQLFLLLLEENGIIAVLMTEITKTDVVFRCRVSDPEWLSRSRDPYECFITLIPPHDRFRSVIDVKFECVRLDSNEIEYPWNSLRLPIRHFIAETAFQINVFPRSVMMQAIPYLHRYRQLTYSTVEEETKCSSEATLSNPESVRTDFELLSIPSSNSDDQTTDFGSTCPDPWENEELERVSLSINEGRQSIENDQFPDCFNRCQHNEISTTIPDKPTTRRVTASVFCNRPINDDDQEITEEMRIKTTTSRNLFGDNIINYPKTTSRDNISNSSSNSEKLPENVKECIQAFEDVFDGKNHCQETINPTTSNGSIAAKDFDCFSTLSSNSDDRAIEYVPSPGECENKDDDEVYKRSLTESLKNSDCKDINKNGVFMGGNDECQKNDIIITFHEIGATGTDDFSPPISPSDCPPLVFISSTSEYWGNYSDRTISPSEKEHIQNMSGYGSDDTDKECRKKRIPTVCEELNTKETITPDKTRNEEDQPMIEGPLKILIRKSSSSTNLLGNTGIHQKKYSSSEVNLLNSIMLSPEDLELLSISSSYSDDAPLEFRATSPHEWKGKDYDELSKKSSPKIATESVQDDTFVCAYIKCPTNGVPEESNEATEKPNGVIKKSSIGSSLFSHTDIGVNSQIEEKQTNNLLIVQEEHNYFKQIDEIKYPHVEIKNEKPTKDKTVNEFSSKIVGSADAIDKSRKGKNTKNGHQLKYTEGNLKERNISQIKKNNKTNRKD